MDPLGELGFKTTFIILRVIYLVPGVDICTDGTKATVGTNAGTSAPIGAVPTKLYYSHCILPHRHTVTVCLFLNPINNAFDEAFYFEAF